MLTSLPSKLTIVSGGQTGADRAGLDWAIANEIEHGGWCPKGRKCSDGVLSSIYKLSETPRSFYIERTEWNVRDSDVTLIFTMSDVLDGGSKRTAEFAQKHAKPFLHIHPSTPIKQIIDFLSNRDLKRLNIAGKSAANANGIYEFVFETLNKVFHST
jgi:hypothetical protein